MSFTENVIL